MHLPGFLHQEGWIQFFGQKFSPNIVSLHSLNTEGPWSRGQRIARHTAIQSRLLRRLTESRHLISRFCINSNFSVSLLPKPILLRGCSKEGNLKKNFPERSFIYSLPLVSKGIWRWIYKGKKKFMKSHKN